MNLYMIQFDMEWENREANHHQVQVLLENAAPEPGSLLVLPEMFSTGFSMNIEVTAQTDNRQDELFLKDLAKKWQSAVLAGVVTRSGEDPPFNEAVAFSSDGEELIRYAKQQTFSFGGENETHRTGEQSMVFEWQGLNVAPLVCYDLRFPEHFRAAVDIGAEVLVIIASWPARRQLHWDALLKARAIENQAYVVGVNRCGSDPNANYVGGSVVYDPLGIQIAHAGQGSGVTEVTLDPEHLRGWRQKFPALHDRKIKTPK